MINFNVNYDTENDDLFVYLDGAKSDGAVEAGNFIFDFNKKGELIAIEIMEASSTLSNLLSKIINLDKIKEFKAESTTFRNMASIKFSVTDDNSTETTNVLVPRIIKESPALNY